MNPKPQSWLERALSGRLPIRVVGGHPIEPKPAPKGPKTEALRLAA